MNPITTLTIAAQSDADFDELMERAFTLFDCQPVKFHRTNGGQSMSYEAPILLRFEGNDEKRLVTLDFDTKALQILGADLGGREALAVGECAAGLPSHERHQGSQHRTH